MGRHGHEVLKWGLYIKCFWRCYAVLWIFAFYHYLAADAIGSNVYWTSGDSTAYQKWSFEEV